MLATAQAVVPLQFVEVVLMFFLEHVVVEECSSKLFCNSLYSQLARLKSDPNVRLHCRKRMVLMMKENAPMTSG